MSYASILRSHVTCVMILLVLKFQNALHAVYFLRIFCMSELSYWKHVVTLAQWREALEESASSTIQHLWYQFKAAMHALHAKKYSAPQAIEASHAARAN
eukprot:5205-Heterococcus_DN1.PRE.3